MSDWMPETLWFEVAVVASIFAVGGTSCSVLLGVATIFPLIIHI